MGDSLPPPASFDLISSFARQRGTDVEIVLADPKVDLPAGEIPISLRRGRNLVEAVGRKGDGGTQLVVRFPRAAVDDGRWALALEHGENPRERIDARLLVQGRRPLVLLWGAKNPASAVPTRRKPVALRRRAAAVAGRAPRPGTHRAAAGAGRVDTRRRPDGGPARTALGPRPVRSLGRRRGSGPRRPPCAGSP